MLMRRTFRLLMLWLAGGALGMGVALVWLTGSMVDNEMVPMGPDSFLHARRILDAYADLGAFYQWDIKSFGPDGAFNHWPWPYDLGLALTLKALVPFLQQAPMTILAYIPTAWTFVTAGWLVLICRQLHMRDLYTALFIVGFFLAPNIQLVHGVGRIDHDFMELTFVLASVWLTLRWIEAPDRLHRGLLLGLCLGLANGINITLFLLQMPLLMLASYRWLHGVPFNGPALTRCCSGLVLTTLTIAVFSGPLQQGSISYSYLSWFQVYVACSTAVFLLLFAKIQPSLKGTLVLVSAALLLIAPVLQEMLGGVEFMANSQSAFLSHVAEARSPWTVGMSALAWYSGGLLLAPVIMIGAVLYLVKGKHAIFHGLAIFCLFGLTLLLMRYRFSYFGTYALFLPWLCFVDHWQRRRYPTTLPRVGEVTRSKTLAARYSVPMVAIIALALLQIPSFQYLWLDRNVGYSDTYERTRPLYLYLGELCEQQPGLVLAPLVSGNYIRYHTHCSVLGTAQFGAKNRQTLQGARALRLLGADPQTALQDPLQFDYVFVSRTYGTRTDVPQWAQTRNTEGLNGALLGASQVFPAGYRLLMAADFDRGGEKLGLARLFSVERLTVEQQAAAQK
ncbi:MAG: hypothetical protein ACJAWK_001534 [Candidatus Azotimanducaceae bacterium]|jgi:hypothetical protein